MNGIQLRSKQYRCQFYFEVAVLSHPEVSIAVWRSLAALWQKTLQPPPLAIKFGVDFAVQCPCMPFSGDLSHTRAQLSSLFAQSLRIFARLPCSCCWARQAPWSMAAVCVSRMCGPTLLPLIQAYVTEYGMPYISGRIMRYTGCPFPELLLSCFQIVWSGIVFYGIVLIFIEFVQVQTVQSKEMLMKLVWKSLCAAWHAPNVWKSKLSQSLPFRT